CTASPRLTPTEHVFPQSLRKRLLLKERSACLWAQRSPGGSQLQNALTPVHKDSVSTSLMFKWAGAHCQSKPPVPLAWKTTRIKHDAAFRSQNPHTRFHGEER